MNKEELKNRVSELIGGNTKKLSGECIDAVISVITSALVSGEKVSLTGFGTFEVSERAAREGVNPRTGEKMQIESSKTPKFKAGSALKNAVKGR